MSRDSPKKFDSAELEPMKAGMRSMWMAGDFGQIAKFAAKSAEEFVERLAVGPGIRVLDVACGTGNLAIPAAKRGADVEGVDIAPNLIEQARGRAEAEGVRATFKEGDAEELPYGNGAFDLVMSMFGAMFALRPDRAAAELGRVCRPRGVIAMANWIPEGFVGKQFQVTNRHVPPPAGIAAPALWGVDAVVRQRLGTVASEIETAHRAIIFDYPFPPSEVVHLFREYFGPTRTAFARLDGPGQAALAADMEQLWTEHNEAGAGETRITAEYLEVRATRM